MRAQRRYDINAKKSTDVFLSRNWGSHTHGFLPDSEEPLAHVKVHLAVSGSRKSYNFPMDIRIRLDDYKQMHAIKLNSMPVTNIVFGAFRCRNVIR